jgi:hypothetical protein
MGWVARHGHAKRCIFQYSERARHKRLENGPFLRQLGLRTLRRLTVDLTRVCQAVPAQRAGGDYAGRTGQWHN